MTVDEPCQPEQVASEARTVGQQAVEPTQMRGDAFYDQSDIDHGEKRSYADNVPLPVSEKEIAAGNGEYDQRRIHPDLDFGERSLCHLA